MRLIIRSKSVDVRYPRNDVNTNFIVIRNGLFLPKDKDCKIEIGFYNAILNKEGILIDDFFDIDSKLNLSEVL